MIRQGILALVIVAGIASCGLACSFWFMSDYGKNPSPETYPLQQIEALMKTVETHPGEPLPTDEVPFFVDQCWNFLQEAMAANNNRYELVVTGIFSDDGTPIPNTITGTTSVVIEVRFPDGKRARMDFYAANFDECRPLTDAS